MKRVLFSLLLLVIFSLNQLNCQNPPCNPNFLGLTFNVNHLQYYPPYSMSMPYEVLIPYIALDSLSRHGDYKQILDFLNRQTYNDTVKYIYKYYFNIVNYDPIKYFQSLRDSIGLVSVPPGLIDDAILNTVKRVSPNKDLDYAILRASYIFRISITDTIFVQDTNSKLLGKNIYIVTSEIVDTIKGKIIPNCKNFNNSSYANKKGDKVLINSGIGECLQFYYCLDWTRGGNYGPTLRDDLGKPWIKKNQEYIIFLNAILECSDYSGVYYSIRPTWPESYTFRMYPINNGLVYDPKNEFGFGNNISVENFVNNIKNRISQI